MNSSRPVSKRLTTYSRIPSPANSIESKQIINLTFSEVPYVFRYLGRFPSEPQVKNEALTIVLKDKDSPRVPYEDLEEYMLKVLKGTDYMPAGFDRLMKCFKALDKHDVGFIKVDHFKQLVKKSE